MSAFFPAGSKGRPTATAQAATLGGTTDGVLAEEVVLEAATTIGIPDTLSFEEAATLPCAGLTAWVGLAALGRLQPGETVLAMGTGGVSVFALQIAKAMGATVIVTSSGDDKLARAKALGADGIINYRQTPDWDARVLALTDEQGVDHILEVGGAKTLPASLRALRDGGHLVLVGHLGGERRRPRRSRTTGACASTRSTSATPASCRPGRHDGAGGGAPGGRSPVPVRVRARGVRVPAPRRSFRQGRHPPRVSPLPSRPSHA